ncbi:uncharacterized protein Z519_05873 [Cladophialophora bantiana CBS 173.52]|uniref:BTB domain-containing protein n=1 Tax=Cladophialophora bantiana (strain ATCC 10958 / CBS 173.52 / CDC B-1940 / NIH 8579) TaxID=1442370 RepID=A0A0D2HIZ4_CLAB1|nr:uncharacterized protein Z519_05873 [Cladophialophora bantiana CBS 173.52]KIW93268.1 hypothetical protein Z519_05873 [Cladophialophora bantiana CBS 173.52]
MDHIQEEHADKDESSCRSLMGEPADEMEALDPKGDVVLVVGRRHLLVSSRVLELSCPFFRKMLQSNAFMEGANQPNAERPPIKQLQEDHPDIFYLICVVLHYRPAHPPDSIDDYRILADLCNFYGCSRALSFHVRAWTDSLELSSLTVDALQSLLWVAFVFHLRNLFQRVSLYLAETLTTGTWKLWDVHPMPARLKDDVKELCENVTNTVQQRIERMIDEAGANNERHVGKRDKICSQCFSNKPLETKKCGYCGSNDFRDYLCTKEVRLSLFKEWLQSQGYWPLSRLNGRSCRSFLGSMPSPAGTRTPCGFDDSCPLTGAKERLVASLRMTHSDCVGLELEDYDSGDFPEMS